MLGWFIPVVSIKALVWRLSLIVASDKKLLLRLKVNLSHQFTG